MLQMFVLKVCVDFLELMKECMIFFREGGREEKIKSWCIYVHETCFVRTLRGQDEVANLEAGRVAVFAQC